MAPLLREGGVKNEDGLAMVTAIAAALVVALTAAAVLTITFRRFEFSVFRSDRSAALAETDGATRWIFRRLEVGPDPAHPPPVHTNYAEHVRAALIASAGGGPGGTADPADPYVISPEAAGTSVNVRYNNAEMTLEVDEQAQALNLARPVHVIIDFEPQQAGNPVPNSDRRFRIHASAEFGTGE